MKVYFIRHGWTEYQQGRVTYEEANDLTEDGVIHVADSSAEIAELIKKGEKVAFVSSPFGRTLATVKVVRKVLLESGLSELDFTGVLTEEDLGEVRDFEWEPYSHLILGNEAYVWQGHEFAIDRNKTNPRDVEAGQYYFENMIAQISVDVLAKFPSSYVEFIQGIETSRSVMRRTLGFIQTAVEKYQDYDHLILVAHDCNSSLFTVVFTKGKMYSLGRGDFLTLDVSANGIFVEDVKGWEGKGDSSTEVVLFAKSRFGV